MKIGDSAFYIKKKVMKVTQRKYASADQWVQQKKRQTIKGLVCVMSKPLQIPKNKKAI